MGKKSKYYHSEVEVEDISFQPLFGYDLKLYRPIIKKFNECNTTKEKQEISKELPNELFCYCRFCGKPIVNSISNIEIHKNGSFNLHRPSVKERIIDNKKYELSCCEDCLLEYFKDCPPKAPKYYNMKANKYGAYSFGYSEEEYKKIASMTVGVTEKSMIRKWGEKEGLKKWKEYCNKHSYIASKDAYIDKYGKKEGLSKYYNDRAITLQMCINRHGKEKGLAMWKQYCERQRYTCSKEYFINTYGEKVGIPKYENYVEKRKNNIFKLQECSNAFSRVSQDLFINLESKLNIGDEIYYNDKNKEYVVKYKSYCYFLDFYDKTKNIVIEFNGDYWHCNPSIYKGNEQIQHRGKIVTPIQVWNNDSIRKKNICKQLNNPTYIVVWESDYRKDKKETIEKLLKYFN